VLPELQDTEGCADLRFCSPHSQPDNKYGTSASRGVPVYVPAYAGRPAHFIYHRGMARLSWPASVT